MDKCIGHSARVRRVCERGKREKKRERKRKKEARELLSLCTNGVNLPVDANAAPAVPKQHKKERNSSRNTSRETAVTTRSTLVHGATT